jgi:threonine aldolase
MINAMFSAKTGDDVFGEDPTVNALQDRVATMFGQEAGLFCPSGTMTNQVAIRVHCQPGDEVICSSLSHVYLYEGGGMARNSGASAKMVVGDRGRISSADVIANINPDDAHFPISKLVSIEDTMNKGGGCTYELEEIEALQLVCKDNQLGFHLDGARALNALVATGYDTTSYGRNFDSISICFSKGLGCPIGSLLLGSEEFIKKAHRVRKSFGGGMRQAGILAAAADFALDHHVDRLVDDHNRAKALASALDQSDLAQSVLPVTTNIVVFSTRSDASQELGKLKEKGILAVPFGAGQLRFVTHLDFNDEHLDTMCQVIKNW